MLCVQGLTKRYGPVLAVDDVSFTVRAGHVTGFLGPNGSGKSTTMRLVLGLDRPTAGEALIDGRPYASLRRPLLSVGALLDARAVHPGRRGADHLLALAVSNGIDRRRVGEVLEQVGLGASVGRRRAGGYSLGMAQRLGLAAALLGDPAVLLLDEPMNGLDTEGIRWLRSLLRGTADDGRAVLVSSHLLSEVELVADWVVVIDGGRLRADTTVDDLVAAHSSGAVVVRSADDGVLRGALVAAGGVVEPEAGGGWRVGGLAAAAVGEAAFVAGVAVHELRPVRSTLEDAYREVVAS